MMDKVIVELCDNYRIYLVTEALERLFEGM